MITRLATCKGVEKPVSVPITAITADLAGMHSPRIGKANGVPAPHFPGSPGFDEQLREVIEVRRQVELRHWPREFLEKDNPSGLDGTMPTFLRGSGIGIRNPESAAHYVAMDAPPDLGVHIFRQMVAAGIPFRKKYGFVPFHEEITGFQERLIIAIREAHELGWQVKCFYGLERPETVLGLPGCVFCAGTGEAPAHFSYVANHATGYGATYNVLFDTFDIQRGDDNDRMMLDATWQGAQYRTLLGVHYPQDNKEGFKLGRGDYK